MRYQLVLAAPLSPERKAAVRCGMCPTFEGSSGPSQPGTTGQVLKTTSPDALASPHPARDEEPEAKKRRETLMKLKEAFEKDPVKEEDQAKEQKAQDAESAASPGEREPNRRVRIVAGVRSNLLSTLEYIRL